MRATFVAWLEREALSRTPSRKAVGKAYSAPWCAVCRGLKLVGTSRGVGQSSCFGVALYFTKRLKCCGRKSVPMSKKAVVPLDFVKVFTRAMPRFHSAIKRDVVRSMHTGRLIAIDLRRLLAKLRKGIILVLGNCQKIIYLPAQRRMQSGFAAHIKNEIN